MRVVCVSDTHAQFGRLIDGIPSGDLLIHAGDITNVGDMMDVYSFKTQLGKVRHKYKDIVVIAGNHDFCFEYQSKHRSIAEKLLEEAGVKYLHDSGMDIGGLKVYGSPYQPEFFDWAFNLPRGNALMEKWKLIPDDVDILITHGPPYQILDEVHYQKVGCYDLACRVKKLKNLKLHVFGHIHPSYGQVKIGNTIFVNAAQCDDSNFIANKPIIVDI